MNVIRRFALIVMSILAALVLIPPTAFALNNSAKVPILLYHSWVRSGCTQATNQSIGLEADLELLYQQGYTVVPVYWLAKWAVGDLDGSYLPDKVVGITFDDGENGDWYDTFSNGCYTKSFYNVLKDFKNLHPNLPWYSPHAASFVIASPVARDIISPGTMTDEWWNAAQQSGLMEIYNHSTDHDHNAIQGPILEPNTHFSKGQRTGVFLAVGGYKNGNWNGAADFSRTSTYETADAEVRGAANYISSKIGVWPDLFAYPYGGYTSYLVYTYFPNFWSEHQTYAAFSTDPLYVTRSSNRFALGRFVRGRDWSDGAGLQQILVNSGQ
ncbi:Polysaccharide deacetylase [Nitrosococcus oceani ATCC 19707]|uniref:Polysaccharide deacetylase n=2 Tax=Nitrosococcus oceani TaxID=1229 RepID=Q3JB30_NITOC|nr:polysaccharide deacetylase family protein [Nitrosococcus oceani]ABA57966.1 Polysaccharide deacetylase [Nitrosococcus oceani ATCC 19707]EDZ67405.1 Polysaccharide deacetylase domain protein [Nitrosococcus oceani AFC27]KFI19695.1 polysaccharide deacetylase [Nitrosococcus oceani C-27]GEM19613.1 polysaccharide deacetylase [Nitrosococcus oceani]